MSSLLYFIILQTLVACPCFCYNILVPIWTKEELPMKAVLNLSRPTEISS
nr:MAG TPA: hypothetical protein [Caudoviricetes sp.]